MKFVTKLSFGLATEAELIVLALAIDALTRAEPRLIHESDAWCGIVHEFRTEVRARELTPS